MSVLHKFATVLCTVGAFAAHYAPAILIPGTPVTVGALASGVLALCAAVGIVPARAAAPPSSPAS